MASLITRVLFFVIVGTLTTSSPFGGNNCSDSEFPCDNGQQCVFKNKWCDSVEDCSDDSDEEYCHFSPYYNDDPNFCKGKKFICNNGPCIPFSGRCDGVPSCTDDSDELGCDNSTLENFFEAVENATEVSVQNFTNATTQVTPETSPSPKVRTSAFTNNRSTSKLTTLATTKSTPVHTVPVLPLQDYPRPKSAAIRYVVTEDQETARLKAEMWLLGQQDSDSGQDIARKIVALHLSNETFFTSDLEQSKQISKQLELHLSVDLIRNESKSMDLSKLALYVNALLASCHNPHNFHGTDLARILRLRADYAIKAGKFVSPSVYTTLCVLGKGSYHDIDKLREIFVTQDKQLRRLDIQALAVLAASCYSQVPEFSSISVKLYGAPNLMMASLRNSNYTDVYTTALLIQAFAAAGVTSKDWRLAEALDFLLDSQNPDGSFGDILATYYAMTLLSGNDLESLKNPCYLTDGKRHYLMELKLEDQENVVYISLVFGNSIESALTLQLNVESKASFLDVLGTAGKTNQLFKVKYDQLTTVPVVYSIGDVPNDAERGLFWNLYVEKRKLLTIEEKTLTALTPLMEDIRALHLKNGSHIIFWFKKILA